MKFSSTDIKAALLPQMAMETGELRQYGNGIHSDYVNITEIGGGSMRNSKTEETTHGAVAANVVEGNASNKEPATPAEATPKTQPNTKLQGLFGGTRPNAFRNLFDVAKALSKKSQLNKDSKDRKAIYQNTNAIRTPSLEELLVEAEKQVLSGECKELLSLPQLTDITSCSRKIGLRSVMRDAKSMHDEKKYIQALIMFRVATILQQTEKLSADAKLTFICDRSLNILKLVDDLAKNGGKMRDIGIAQGLEHLKHLLCAVRAVKNATPDAKALTEAKCLYGIAHICYLSDDIIGSLGFGENGVKIFEGQFGKGASKYKWYGRLLSIVGAAYYGLRCFQDANVYNSKAVDAYRNALDFESEHEKIKNLKNSEESLTEVRRRLKE